MRSVRQQRGPGLGHGVLFAVGLLLSAAAQAIVQDISTQFAITRSGLVLNRTTNTFDSTTTLKNVSGAPVLAPIAVVVGGLPSAPNPVTLANKSGDTPDGKPYVSPMAAGTLLQDGGTISFVLKFANPARVSFTSFLQVLYTVEVPPDAPSLIAVVATTGTDARLIGRVDGAPGQPIALQATSAATCVAGTLVGGAAVGSPVATTTDAGGYFAVTVSGVNPNEFVTVRTTSPRASPASLCQISSRDNDSWPKAFPIDTTGLTARDFIDSPGKARWYKFSVVPGQRIQVTLSGLPADYDLAVFKDIGQAFLKQFNPASASTSDLVKLTAEYAPSTFSPSTFSPSTFSPSTFSPDAYAPSTFSPSTFSSDVYSPSTFSPSTFSPSTFSPSTFSPSTFSPSTFSPSTFSPSTFSPSIYDATQIAQAFSTAQTRSVIAVSATPGTGNETAIVNTWNNTGSFYVRVTGRSGAFSTSLPFTVYVVKGDTKCDKVIDTTLSSRSPIAASGLKSVIVTDSTTLALDVPLSTSTGGSLRGKLATFAARADVKGVIVDLAGDTRVQALKQQAVNNPACPYAMNLAAEEIKGIVDSYRANPLQFVVLVGNDETVPYFRFPDQSGLGQESGYVPPVDSNSESEASLRKDFVLSQDSYGSKTRLSLPASEFPVPGLAVGRLVETPSEIAGVIDAYVAANGVVVPGSSLVTGYDFLEDAANAVRSELVAGIGSGGVADALITPNGKSPQDPLSWTATQLGEKLLGSRHDVIFLAGHFSANSALAADFTTSLLTTDLAASTVDLANAIVFSAGCHSGYNLVDTDAIAGVTLPLDWAQAFARKKATLVAGTGYQYGDTDFLEYSERLYNNFARQLRAGTGAVAIGEALVKAKLDYLATTADIRGIHEKALLEAALFGLPMLGVDMPAGRGSAPGAGGAITPVGVSTDLPAGKLGLRTYDLSVAPSLTSHTKSLRNIRGGADVVATWLSGPDGVTTKPGEPALPLDAVNVTPTDPQIVLRGVGFRGGNFVDAGPLLPFSGAPTTELRGVHIPFISPVFFPARMWSPNYFSALAGLGGTELLVTPAQHRVANIVDGTSTQRRFTELGLRLFYSGDVSKAALSDAPSIIAVDAQRVAGDVTFAVQVVGDPAAAIHQVWITYSGEGTGTWASLDLGQCVVPLPAACGPIEDSRLWKGRLTGAPTNLKYLVQAVSGVGLVAVDDRLGAYYGVGGTTPAATTLAFVSPPASGAIGDSVNITAKLTFAGTPVQGRFVAITFGGASQVGTTGVDGTATVKVPVAVPPGSYQISAAFAGDDTLSPSSTTANFDVNKAPSSLAGLTPAGVTLTGTIAGQPQVLQAEAVSFAVTGPFGPLTLWANTNYLGRATLPPPGLLAAGQYTVTQASFGGNAIFAPATLALSQQFTVAKIAQTITFGTLADRSYGAPQFAVFAAASSGLPVSFTANGVCSVTGNTVQIADVGSCTITAHQPGDDAYASAAPQSRTFAINLATQTITFGSVPASASVGQRLVMVTATSTSPTATPSTIPIVFTSQTTDVCTTGGINGAMLSFVNTGECRIAANQAGGGNYAAAAPVEHSFNVGVSSGAPQTFTVTDLTDSTTPGAGSLRAKVASALATLPGPNIVRFAAGLTGTITLTNGAIQLGSAISIEGPGANVVTITTANGSTSRIFNVVATGPGCPARDVPNDYVVSISGLKLANVRRSVADTTGGAIVSIHSLILDGMVFENNSALKGSGVGFWAQYPGQSLTVTNSQFLNNVSTELVPAVAQTNSTGGGIAIGENCASAQDVPYTEPVTVTIANSEFRGNRALPLTVNGQGGAIRSYSLADVVITDTIIVDNHVVPPDPPTPGKTYHGGAIDGAFKSLRIERSEIAENTACYAQGCSYTGSANVTRTGGLHLHKDAVNKQSPGDAMAVKIIDSTISGNKTSDTAGAIVAFGNVALELYNSTVSDNVAGPTRTGGIAMSLGATYPVSGSNTARPTLKLVSSILANNSSSGADIAAGASNFGAFTVNASRSLIEAVCPTPDCLITVSGVDNFLGQDPTLAPLAKNPPTAAMRTHALLPGSPAINTGSNPLGLANDQRGTGFPRVVGGAADMGAYESP